MYDYSDIGKLVVDGYGYSYIVADKAMLINRICDLKPGEGFDWADIDNGNGGTSYRAEKLNWNDSIVVLIGGYGGVTESCYLDDETFSGTCSSCDTDFIESAVNQFFTTRCIDKTESIFIAKS